jgi:hypothetical protein
MLCDCEMLEHILLKTHVNFHDHVCALNMILHFFLYRHLMNVWSYIKLTVIQRTCGCRYHSFVVMLLSAGMCINLDCCNFHCTTISNRLMWVDLAMFLGAFTAKCYKHEPVSCVWNFILCKYQCNLYPSFLKGPQKINGCVKTIDAGKNFNMS